MAENKKFSFPISPLVGSTFRNFLSVSQNKNIDREFRSRYYLSVAASAILDLFGKGESLIKKKQLEETKIDKPPIFILGFWRSGTTFLHNLMCQDPHAAYITTYLSIFPHHCLVNSGWLKKLAQVIAPERRPVDNVKLDMSWPQEEEMALGNIQPLSFYHYFYFPDHTEEYKNRSLLFKDISEKETREWEEAYNLLIKKALILSPGDRFISKNPPNTFRIPQLLNLFPNAKFVYIYRNPYSVLSSFLLFMKQVMLGVGFQNIDNREIDHQLLQLYTLALEKYETDKILIPNGNLIEIQYEKFKENPLNTIEKIYSKFNLNDFSSVKPVLNSYIHSQKHQKSGGHPKPQYLMEFIRKNLKQYMQLKGYEIEP
jgi:hypothetical protein